MCYSVNSIRHYRSKHLRHFSFNVSFNTRHNSVFSPNGRVLTWHDRTKDLLSFVFCGPPKGCSLVLCFVGPQRNAVEFCVLWAPKGLQLSFVFCGPPKDCSWVLCFVGPQKDCSWVLCFVGPQRAAIPKASLDPEYKFSEIRNHLHRHLE